MYARCTSPTRRGICWSLSVTTRGYDRQPISGQPKCRRPTLRAADRALALRLAARSARLSARSVRPPLGRRKLDSFRPGALELGPDRVAQKNARAIKRGLDSRATGRNEGERCPRRWWTAPAAGPWWPPDRAGGGGRGAARGKNHRGGGVW